MRKSKLIAMLNLLPGNPDIKMWNGMVQDWMNIASEVGELREVKLTFEAFQRSVKGSPLNPDLSDKEMRKAYRNCKWSINDYVGETGVNGIWKKRRVLVLEAKLRGKSVHDRIGAIRY